MAESTRPIGGQKKKSRGAKAPQEVGTATSRPLREKVPVGPSPLHGQQSRRRRKQPLTVQNRKKKQQLQRRTREFPTPLPSWSWTALASRLFCRLKGRIWFLKPGSN